MKHRLASRTALLVLLSVTGASCAKEQSPPTFTLPGAVDTPQYSQPGPNQSSQPSTTLSAGLARQEALKQLIPSTEQFQAATSKAGVFQVAQALSDQALVASSDTSVQDEGGWSRTWALADKTGAKSYVTFSVRAFSSAADLTTAIKDTESSAGTLTSSGVYKTVNPTAKADRSARLSAVGQVSLAGAPYMLLVVWEGPAATSKIEAAIADALEEWQLGLSVLTPR